MILTTMPEQRPGDRNGYPIVYHFAAKRLELVKTYRDGLEPTCDECSHTGHTRIFLGTPEGLDPVERPCACICHPIRTLTQDPFCHAITTGGWCLFCGNKSTVIYHDEVTCWGSMDAAIWQSIDQIQQVDNDLALEFARSFVERGLRSRHGAFAFHQPDPT